MFPTRDQIGLAAYHRWVRRDRTHGHHLPDWLASEQDLLFSLNYEVMVRHRLDGVSPLYLGDEDARRCRFCEQTAPRARFSDPRAAIPASLGNTSIHTFEECEDCRAMFTESVAFDLDWFVQSTRFGDENGSLCYVPVAAFKGLARSAMTLLPEDELQYFEDAIEWVGNPDHELDSRTIGGVECTVHTLAEAASFSWTALARRVDDEAEMPYLLGFFGVGHHVFQFPLPLSARDEDLEGTLIIPRVASPFGPGRGPLDVQTSVIALSSTDPRRDLVVEYAGR